MEMVSRKLLTTVVILAVVLAGSAEAGREMPEKDVYSPQGLLGKWFWFLPFWKLGPFGPFGGGFGPYGGGGYNGFGPYGGGGCFRCSEDFGKYNTKLNAAAGEGVSASP